MRMSSSKTPTTNNQQPTIFLFILYTHMTHDTLMYTHRTHIFIIKFIIHVQIQKMVHCKSFFAHHTLSRQYYSLFNPHSLTQCVYVPVIFLNFANEIPVSKTISSINWQSDTQNIFFSQPLRFSLLVLGRVG